MKSRETMVRVLATEANAKGDLFTRLVADVFLALGYDNLITNVSRTGSEIDIEGSHRTESRLLVAECKAHTARPVGARDVALLDSKRGQAEHQHGEPVEAYLVSLSGFTAEATVKARELLHPITLFGPELLAAELVRGGIVTPAAQAAAAAGHLLPPHSSLGLACCDLLAHEHGWVWACYFGRADTKGAVAYIHADGEPVGGQVAQEIFALDEDVARDLLYPHADGASVAPDCEERYRQQVSLVYGSITLEGLPTDEETGAQALPLSELYVPLKLQRQAEGVRPQRVGEVLRRERRAIVLGMPGAGKSTLVKRLATAYADPGSRGVADDRLADEPLLPLVVRCRQLGQNVERPLGETLRRIAVELELSDLKEPLAAIITRRLQHGTALVLVDGLDEIPTASSRVAFSQRLRIFCATYPHVPVVITSREPGFRVAANVLAGVGPRYTITPFTADGTRSLILAWHREVLGDRQAVLMDAEALADTVQGSPRLRSLAANPLLLTTLLLVKRWVGQLPSRRTALYRLAIEVLLSTWNVEAHEPLDMSEALPQLAYIACWMTREGQQTIEATRLEELLIAARADLPHELGYARESVAEFVRRVELRSSLLSLVNQHAVAATSVGVYEFKHLTFQEYLTALAVVKGYSPGGGGDLLDEIQPFIDNAAWSEIIPLAAVLAERDADRLLYRLVEDADSAERVRLVGACLADEPQLTPQTAYDIARYLAGRPDWVMGRASRFPELINSKYSDAFIAAALDAFREDPLEHERYLLSLGAGVALLKGASIDRPEEIVKLLADRDDRDAAVLGAAAAVYAAQVDSPRSQAGSGTRPGGAEIASVLIDHLECGAADIEHAARQALAWLGQFDMVAARDVERALPVLYAAWRSGMTTSGHAAWTLASLPVITAERRPLGVATPSDDAFLADADVPHAACVAAYYLRAPWDRPELYARVRALGQGGIAGLVRQRLDIMLAAMHRPRAASDV